MPIARYALTEDPCRPFLAGELHVKPATEAWERRQYFALRHEVFSTEQRLLAQDKDAQDFQAIPIVALGHACGQADVVVGAVRIYQTHPRTWYGGRLCVAHHYRRHGMIGKALVNEAVSLAIDLGCDTFLATVQERNASYFHTLHWQTLEAIELHGQPHRLMRAELAAYPFMARGIRLPTRMQAHG